MSAPVEPEVEVTESRAAEVGGLPVRRALPRRGRRTVGSWCFADHMGPAPVTPEHGIDVGPHPHIGLQTVTWLVAGEILHRDSLGSEQLIRPGQLNLMTAGAGVAHAEEATGRYRGDLHGIQLWVAQPEATRHGAAAFEHHAALPHAEVDGVELSVLVGDVAGVRSPARRDTEHSGAQLRVPAGRRVALPVARGDEHGIVVLDGVLELDGHVVTPGHLAYVAPGRDGFVVAGVGGAATAMLLAGPPFDEDISMWWNFVGRTHDELEAAGQRWNAHDTERFPPVASHLDRIPAPVPPWRTSTT